MSRVALVVVVLLASSPFVLAAYLLLSWAFARAAVRAEARPVSPVDPVDRHMFEAALDPDQPVVKECEEFLRGTLAGPRGGVVDGPPPSANYLDKYRGGRS